MLKTHQTFRNACCRGLQGISRAVDDRLLLPSNSLIDARRVTPDIRGVRQHLALQKGLDATFLQQWDLLPQVAVGLVFNHPSLAPDNGLKQLAQWIGIDWRYL